MWSGAPGIGRRLLIDEILHFISFYLFETIFWSAFCILHRHFCLSHSSHIHFDVAFMLCSHARHQSTMRIKFYIDVTSRANGSETAQKSCIIFDWWCEWKTRSKRYENKKIVWRFVVVVVGVVCSIFDLLLFDVKWWCRMIDGINQPNRQGKVFAALFYEHTYFSLSSKVFVVVRCASEPGAFSYILVGLKNSMIFFFFFRCCCFCSFHRHVTMNFVFTFIWMVCDCERLWATVRKAELFFLLQKNKMFAVFSSLPFSAHIFHAYAFYFLFSFNDNFVPHWK